MRCPALAVCLVSAGSCAPAFGEFLAVAPSLDNTLYEDPTGSLSNGAGTGVFAGATQTPLIRRGLMSFDLSAIPAGSTITQVALTVHVSSTGSTQIQMGLHKVLASWGEGTSVAGGNGGGGIAAAAGDATWTYRFYNTTQWASPGGDYAALASATTTIGGVSFYTWSGPGMAADVQSWLDSGGNFGWLIKGGESIAGSAKRFDSRETLDPTLRPLLEIQYIPEPGALAALALGAAGLRRRRR
jgi:hypothetical protein